MDNTTTTKTKPPSLRSYHSNHSASSFTLSTKTDQPQQSQPQSQSQEEQPQPSGARQTAGPERYRYYKTTGTPNPDAKPKEKSKLSKFMSKFQSPAVRATNAKREAEKLEEERTGRKIYTVMGTPQGGNAWTAASLS